MPIYTSEFKNPHDFPGLISLAEAANNREIKYNERKPKRPVSVVYIRAYRFVDAIAKRPLRLIPLGVAQQREDIRTRDEGFEIQEEWEELDYFAKMDRWRAANLW